MASRKDIHDGSYLERDADQAGGISNSHGGV